MELKANIAAAASQAWLHPKPELDTKWFLHAESASVAFSPVDFDITVAREMSIAELGFCIPILLPRYKASYVAKCPSCLQSDSVHVHVKLAYS